VLDLTRRVTVRSIPDTASRTYFSGGVRITLGVDQSVPAYPHHSGAGERALDEQAVSRNSRLRYDVIPLAQAERIRDAVLGLESHTATGSPHCCGPHQIIPIRREEYEPV